jgi:hypothetical protein
MDNLRRAYALDALRAAVIADDIASDEEVITRPLADDRIQEFIADVYASRFAFVALEQTFARYKAFVYLAAESPNAPEERGINRLMLRAPFTAAPGWAAYMVHTIGPGLEDDVYERLEAMLAQAPSIQSQLDSAAEVLSSIDLAAAELGPGSDLMVLLVGDFHEVVVELGVTPPDNFVPGWRLRRERPDFPDVEGTYREWPVLLRRGDHPRRIHVLDVASWGYILRAQVEGGTDLRVDVKPIAEAQARDFLSMDPGLFDTEVDDGARLRKLRASVRVNISERVGFEVLDASRVRTIRSSVD